VNLLYTDITGTKLIDGALAAFDTAFSNQVGNEDASKLSLNDERLAIESQFQLLSIDARNLPRNDDTIYISMANLTKPQYTLQIFAKQLDNSTLEPYLEDTYLNTSQFLSLTDTNFINFAINPSVPASQDSNRFHIVFRQTGSLSGVITSIRAIKENRQVKVDWVVSSETGIRKYEIQRADSRKGFTKAGEVAGRGGNTPEDYQWIDDNPSAGINHYRVRIINIDGSVSLSKVVTVVMNDERPQIKVFPNPVQNNEISFQLINAEKGKYVARLFNIKGQMIMDRVIDYDGGSASQQVQIDRPITAGVYFFQLINGKVKLNQNIIIK
jgi:hypothetical protein